MTSKLDSKIDALFDEKLRGYIAPRGCGQDTVDKFLDFIHSIRAEDKKAIVEEERAFILNILDGIDIADKQLGVVGGTKSIRITLKTRV